MTGDDMACLAPTVCGAGSGLGGGDARAAGPRRDSMPPIRLGSAGTDTAAAEQRDRSMLPTRLTADLSAAEPHHRSLPPTWISVLATGAGHATGTSAGHTAGADRAATKQVAEP